MIGIQIKPDYSEAVAKFVANGGQIKPAVNTNKAEFNYCNKGDQEHAVSIAQK